MLTKNIRNVLLLAVLVTYLPSCTNRQHSSFAPNTILPTKYLGFSLSGKRPGGATFEVLVALASNNQQLILIDRSKPLIDPGCPSGCRIFWGVKGIPEISYTLPNELVNPAEYRFQAVGQDANLEIAFFLTTDSGSEQIDAKSWRVLLMQKVDDITFFEAVFNVRKNLEKNPTVSFGFTVTEQGVPVEFQL